jgi:hypothetical protein
MSGIERRSQIDTETFKALLLINGGGTVALISTLSFILTKEGLEPLTRAILFGILIMIFGLAFAIAHNHFRRRCSLKYETHGMNPPKGRVLGIGLPSPTVCFLSWLLMWLSVSTFFIAGLVIAVTGLVTVEQKSGNRNQLEFNQQILIDQ